MEHRTAIILVTYNGWALTKACLKDLEPLFAPQGKEVDDGRKFVVAIADNGSSDGTVENIRRNYPANKYENLRIYPQEKNLGFGAANNRAISALIAEGIEFETLCLLNNDTRLDASAILELQKALGKASTLPDAAKSAKKGAAEDCTQVNAVIAPTLLNADGSRQNNFFAGLGPQGIGSLQFFLNAFRGESGAAKILEGTPMPVANCTELLETHWTSAVCWMLTRKLWDAAGGFDEKIFMYYEDGDLALRMRKLGARFFIHSQCAITHLGGGSAANNLSRAIQHDRSQQYVFKKHFG
ncbi:MAG: glycosyltransferase family 2 protein, partial [Fibrobacter sp.]|nr:glycosyltransferase family 2 protein [Fibrobacter sp.]